MSIRNKDVYVTRGGQMRVVTSDFGAGTPGVPFKRTFNVISGISENGEFLPPRPAVSRPARERFHERRADNKP